MRHSTDQQPNLRQQSIMGRREAPGARVAGADRPSTRLTAATLARRLGSTGSPAGGPAYRVLAHQIRNAVLDGRIAVSSGLPSERELSAALTVSRTTVAAAYALLREEGWLDSRRGSGSRLRLPGDGGAGKSGGAVDGPAGIFGHLPVASSDVLDLSTASLPAAEPHLTNAVTAAVADLPTYTGGDGYAPFGLPVLREAIAARYTRSGAPTRADQILVTNGAQHALSLAMHGLSGTGDRVLLECPTYPLALDAVRAAGRVPTPVGMSEPLDESGKPDWDIDLLRSTLRQTAPRLAYLLPDFQNPTGALMSLAAREQVLAACRSSGVTLLIDESFRDAPFPSLAELPPPMAALGDPERVLSLGSVSKTFWGGLRIGWIRASAPVIERLAAARALGDMAGPVLEQLIVSHLLAAPDEALATQRERLASGARMLLALLAEVVPDWRPTRPEGGAFLWVKLPGPFAAELARLAPSVGVRIAPGPRFGPDGTMESYFRLPFTASPDRLEAGIRRLAAVADQAAASRPAGLPGWIA